MDSTNTANKAYGAKLLFWYLRVFFAMGFCACATGTLWYQFINKWFPLQISPYGGVFRPYADRAVIWGISTLFIIGPILFVFAAMLREAIKRNEVELHRGVRQWLTYVFLFIVVTVMVGDLITAVYYVLNGDYSTRFFLKVFTVLAISGWLISYVWLDIRSEDGLAGSALPRRMGIASAIVMLASLGVGFTLIDSPMLARAKAFDNQRASDIQQLQGGVQNYFNRYQRMPESLEELREEGMIRIYALEDPDTGEPYEFRVVNEQNPPTGRRPIRYEICAVFTTDNRDEEEEFYGPRGPYGSSFLHGAERTCFEQNIQETPGRQRLR